MKKLFTLVASVLMSLSSMATETILISEPITLSNWKETSVFTMTSDQVHVGDFLKISIASSPSGGQVLVKKADYSDILPGDISPVGVKAVYYQITDELLAELTGSGLRLQGNKDVEVSSVSLVTQDEFNKVVAYQGPGTIDAAWGSVTVNKANFNIVKDGDIVVVDNTNNCESKKGENVLFKKNGYEDAASIYNLLSPWCITMTDDLAAGYFGKEDNHVQAGKAGVVVNSLVIYRLKSNVPSNIVTLTDEPVKLDNFSGSVVVNIPASSFADAQLGDEIHFALTDVDNSKSYSAQVKMVTNADGWPLLISNVDALNVSYIPEFVYLIKDEATLNTLKATGLIVQGTGATISSVKLYTSTPTAISQISSKPSQSENAVYNLAGQQVGKSYKGIVIKNGKKYVQK